MQNTIKTIVGSAILAVFLSVALDIPEARATGKPMNLTAYCNAKHNPDGRGLSWQAKYYPRERLWWCEQATETGPVSRGGGRKIINPPQACLFMHGTLKIHTHRGLDYAVESNMHCGVHSGLMPSEADMQPASMTLCNNTSAAKLSVGYAYWDRRGRYTPNWRSKGHWILARGECETFALPTSYDHYGYRGELYVFGGHRGALIPGRGKQMCVWGFGNYEQPSADDSSACTKNGYRMMPTTRVEAVAGEVRHAFSD